MTQELKFGMNSVKKKNKLCVRKPQHTNFILFKVFMHRLRIIHASSVLQIELLSMEVSMQLKSVGCIRKG
jgi:hypothetical protein